MYISHNYIPQKLPAAHYAPQVADGIWFLQAYTYLAKLLIVGILLQFNLTFGFIIPENNLIYGLVVGVYCCCAGVVIAIL